jgi:molecular chaperone DnaK
MGQAWMSYRLGIDVGTTFTAAAICREQPGRRVLPEVVPLGGRSAAVSSVVYLGQDGQLVVGEAAERRAVTEPDRVVREFTRRIGDEALVVIDGVPRSAAGITASVVGWVVERVAQREGEPARGVTVTHPACWDAHKIQLMAGALRAAGLPEVMFCAAPQAAAMNYSIRQRVELGATIAVYDLGGATFTAAVVRRTGAATFSVLGIPEGIERRGGADFDAAVFGHVVAAVPALSELTPETPAVTPRLQRSVALCRRECTEAKEALSVDTEVTIPVLLPEAQAQVRLVRAEFEDLIHPQVTETVAALRRALRSADVGPDDLDTVLLVGGSSRVPLVAQLVSAELGRPVEVDADPQAAVVLGAAACGLPAAPADATDIDIAGTDVGPDTPDPITVRAGAGGFAESAGSSGAAGSDVPEPAQTDVPNRPPWLAIPLDVEPADAQWRRTGSHRLTWFVAAGFLALVLAGGAVSVPFLTSHHGPVPPEPARSPAPALPLTPAAPVAPVAVVPPPNTGNSTDNGPSTGEPAGVLPTAPAAAPDSPADTPTKPKTVVPAPQSSRRTNGSRTTGQSSPPASTTAPRPPTPEWVTEARNWQ